ncbi:MAG: hypothetical protein PHQ27_08065, partial [Victivallales bacterium]|nr:hypothetical protein [Victivallales bacterium]
GGNGRRVLMFELPVLNRAAGCRAGQRDAAARTGTTILPRRLLGRLVYSGHAAASAHRRLAAELLPLLRPLAATATQKTSSAPAGLTGSNRREGYSAE